MTFSLTSFPREDKLSQFSDVEENRTEAPRRDRIRYGSPSAINGNPSWHLADSPAVIDRPGKLDARGSDPHGSGEASPEGGRR